MAGPAALLIVRNPCTHDARVLRAANVLHRAGFSPSILAVTSTSIRRRTETVGGIPVRRLDPDSPLGWARRRVRSAPTGGTPPGSDTSLSRRGWATPLVRLHRHLRTLDFYRRALGVVLRERPALIHCNDYNTMWIGAAARVLTSARVVYDSHELWPDRNQRPEWRWWLLFCEAILVRCAHAVVAASPGYADVMARRYRIDRPAVVRNIPELGRVSAPENADWTRDLLVYAGAITVHRGLEQAITAVSLLPGVRLRVLGPGRAEYLDMLRNLADSLGVGDRVDLLPPVSPGDVIDEVAKASVGLALFQPVCLSHELVAPNKLFEYMAAGLPTLASDLPVVRATLDEWGCGLTARATDPQDIASRARELLEPSRNAQMRRAAARAATQVTWSRERAVLEQVYGGRD